MFTVIITTVVNFPVMNTLGSRILYLLYYSLLEVNVWESDPLRLKSFGGFSTVSDGLVSPMNFTTLPFNSLSIY